MPLGHRVKYRLDQAPDWTNGPLDNWTIFWIIFWTISKPAFYQKVIFRVGILFIYGAEEAGNGNMKMATKQ